jgi:uncharacterized protein (UPF0332 family)
MLPKHILDKCMYSLEKATDELDTSGLLLENKKLSKSLNCSYYAIFHAARALLLTDNIERSKHSGLISEFIKQYIATDRLDKKYSKIIKNAEKIRINTDYKFFYIVSRDEASQQLEDAKAFVAMIIHHLESKLGIPLEGNFKIDSLL